LPVLVVKRRLTVEHNKGLVFAGMAVQRISPPP
jgi:hypothetical protein